MKKRFNMAESLYSKALQIARLPAWDDTRLFIMFSLARLYHQSYDDPYHRRHAYCIGLKALKAAHNAAQEASTQLEEVKDKRERSLRVRFMKERFWDIVALLKSIREEAPEADYNNQETIDMC